MRRALVAAALLGVGPRGASPTCCCAKRRPGRGRRSARRSPVLAGRARQPAGARRWRGAHRLLPAFRAASLLTDALAARSRSRRRTPVRPPAAVPAPGLRRDRRAERRAQGGPGTTEARARGLPRSRQPSGRRPSSIGWPGLDDAPGDPVLHAALRAAAPRCRDGTGSRDQDPPVQIEVVGRAPGARRRPAARPRGRRVARRRPIVAPERLRFAVPRAAFRHRRRRRTALSRPARCRSVALPANRDVPASVHRAARPSRIVRPRPAGANDDARSRTRWCRRRSWRGRRPARRARCAAASIRQPGWRFDQESRRVVIVERLGWHDDLGDPTLNGGSVEFVPEDKPGQICIAVIARPVTRQRADGDDRPLRGHAGARPA